MSSHARLQRPASRWGLRSVFALPFELPFDPPLDLACAFSVILPLALLLAVVPGSAGAQDFVTVSGTGFQVDGHPYSFGGGSYWYGMWAGRSDVNGGERARLGRELDQLLELGITNLRVMASSEGPNSEPWRIVPALQTAPGVYDPALLDGLDYFVWAMKSRGIRAVMVLNNFYPWSGGMAQYVSWSTGMPIPYPPPEPGGNWDTYKQYTDDFYSDATAQGYFNNFIAFLLARVNPYTGIAYKDEPAIMAWELANEPRGFWNPDDFNIWIDATAAYIKSLDSNHLVTTGCEGDTPWPIWDGMDFDANHDGPDIDYATIHIWPQNWLWFDPLDPAATYPATEANARAYFRDHAARAALLPTGTPGVFGKPLVLEEFGLARDGGSFDPASTTRWRDSFFAAMQEEVFLSAREGGVARGDNFWSWAGEGRPLGPPYGFYWSPGDPIIGDAPYEIQGWLSVYDTDATTLSLASAHALEMEALSGVVPENALYLEPVGDESSWPGMPFRWKDVATNLFSQSYRDSYTYALGTVRVEWQPTAEARLTGIVRAARLKPNFCYQIKLFGKPSGLDYASPDAVSNERIGYVGRWYEHAPGGGNRNDAYIEEHIDDPAYVLQGYLYFQFLVTDRFGNAVVPFESDYSWHVTWRLDQRTPQTCDGPQMPVTVVGHPEDPAYDGEISSAVSLFAEYEPTRTCYPTLGVTLPTGDYDCGFVLTEESFHESGLGGGWAGAMESPELRFCVTRSQPSVTTVRLENLTLAHTDQFAKNGDDLRLSAIVTDDDLSPANITADLSGLLVGGGLTAVAADSYDGTTALWTSALAGASLQPDGLRRAAVRAVDDDAHSVTRRDAIRVDSTPPDAVTGLAAAPGHEKVTLTWDNASGSDAYYRGVALRALAWSDYPEYDAPDPGYPADGTQGLGIYDGLGTSAVHAVVPRDIFRYSVFAYDEARNYSPAVPSAQASATNYWLGDVAAEGRDGDFDGRVSTPDISALGGTYYQPPIAPEWNPHCDVGPTGDGSRLGIPFPDDWVDFEDLVIFAMNFGRVAPMPLAPPGELDASGASGAALALRLAGRIDPAVAGGKAGEERLIFSIVLEDAGARVQAAHAVVGFDPAVWSHAGTEPGTLLADCEDVLFLSPLVGDCPAASAAALGAGRVLGGSGEIARMELRRVGPGDALPRLVHVSLRDAANRDLAEPAASEGVAATDPAADLPCALRLDAVCPNPLVEETWIRFGLPEAGLVELALYDVGGRLVRRLAGGLRPAGEHVVRWDRRDEAGRGVAQGVYLLRLAAQAGALERKVLVAGR